MPRRVQSEASVSPGSGLALYLGPHLSEALTCKGLRGVPDAEEQGLRGGAWGLVGVLPQGLLHGSRFQKRLGGLQCLGPLGLEDGECPALLVVSPHLLHLGGTPLPPDP